MAPMESSGCLTIETSELQSRQSYSRMGHQKLRGALFYLYPDFQIHRPLITNSSISLGFAPDAAMTTRPEDYTVGWICAIPTEYVVACELLDEEYTRDKASKVNTTRDGNSYTFGRIHDHTVVVACLPKGRYGTTSAAILADRIPVIRLNLHIWQ